MSLFLHSTSSFPSELGKQLYILSYLHECLTSYQSKDGNGDLSIFQNYKYIFFPSIDGTLKNILWKYEYLRTLMLFQIYKYFYGTSFWFVNKWFRRILWNESNNSLNRFDSKHDSFTNQSFISFTHFFWRKDQELEVNNSVNKNDPKKMRNKIYIL